MRMPKIGLIAYEELGWIFVLDPSLHGRYIRTDKSVAYNGCPHCKAVAGEPCFKIMRTWKDGKTVETKKYGGTTHYVRREARKPQNYKSFKPKRDNLPLIEESTDA